jgi:hypothetical protein
LSRSSTINKNKHKDNRSYYEEKAEMTSIVRFSEGTADQVVISFAVAADN